MGIMSVLGAFYKRISTTKKEVAMRRFFVCVSVVFALVIGNWLFGSGDCYAAIPQRMNYQGKLTDASGNLVSDGSYDMRFKIWSDETFTDE